MALKFEIDGDTSGFVSAMQKVQQSFETTSEKVDRMAKDLDDGLASALNSVKDRIAETEQQIGEGTKAIDETKRSIASLTEEMEQAADYGAGEEIMKGFTNSLEELNNKLAAQEKNLDDSKKSLDEYNKKLKIVEETTEKVNEARKKENSGLVSIVGGQKNYQEILSKMPPQIQGVVSGFSAMTKAAMAFIATPLGLVIAAIGVAVKALSSYLTGTVEGQKKFAAASGYVQGILAKLNKEFVSLGKNISKVFEDPIASIKKFGYAIVENLINRLKAYVDTIVIFGDMIKDLFTANWDALSDDAKKFGNAWLTVATGVDDVSSKMKDFVKEANEAGKAMSELAVKENELNVMRSKWSVERQRLEAERKKIVETMTEGTLDEQLEAAKKAIEINDMIAKKDREYAQQAYDIIKKRNEISVTSNEDVEKENQALAEVERVDAEQAANNRMLQRNIVNIQKRIRESAVKLTEAQQDMYRSIIRNQEDNEIALQEASIATMHEGYEKQRKARELEYEKNKKQIQRQQEDQIKAARDAAKNTWSADQANVNKAWDDSLLDKTGDEYSALSDNDRLIVDRYRALVAAARQAAQVAGLQAQQSFENGIANVDLTELGRIIEWEPLFKNAPKALRDVLTSKKNAVLKNLKIEGDTTDLDIAIDKLLKGKTEEEVQAGSDMLNNIIEIDKSKIDQSVTGIGKLTNSFNAMRHARELEKKADEEGSAELGVAALNEKEAAMQGYASATVIIADSLSQAADSMKKLAAATGDADLDQAADRLGSLAQNFSAAAKGAATGGWIGAIVAGASDMISQVLDSITSLYQQEEALKQFYTNFRNEILLLKLTLNDDDYETIFGVKSINKAVKAYSIGKQAMIEYNKAVNKLNKEGMMVLTKDYTGISSWFHDDEYTSLKSLAPQLWGAGGVFDTEAAKAFLATSTQLSDSQRAQIQNIIDLKEKYDEAKEAVDEFISSTTTSLAQDLTTAIFDSIRTGSNAWNIFEQKGAEVIDSLGKQLIQEKYVQAYLDQFTGEMEKALNTDNPMVTLTNVFSRIYEGLPEVLSVASEAAEAWDQLAQDNGFDLSNVGSSSSSNSGVASNFTQDSVDEANGRMASLQMGQQAMIDGQNVTNSKIDSLVLSSETGNSYMSDIRDLAAINNGYLSDIYERLGMMHGVISSRLTSIDNNTKSI